MAQLGSRLWYLQRVAPLGWQNCRQLALQHKQESSINMQAACMNQLAVSGHT